ncbi:MAG: 5-deoxy-glucuronate isomerase [Chloroflexi bacterium]|nr:MAG: 5-deoxy-glucuronate isomerase [Chloroflexota bacterium]TMF38241.1 MAG: 5-deoxy-glucuronate isomerase [Chloroflexota bacterium]
MTKLVLRRPSKPAGEGPVAIVTPESAGWSYVGFEVYELRRGDGIRPSTGAREVCVVMLRGQADVSAGSRAWKDVGARNSVFEGTPDAVYAPPGQQLEITASSEVCELAMCWASASRGAEPARIQASEIRPFKRGSGRTERTIHNILMEDRPAESLLVTEVLTPAGNWSSYPPHKHDTDDVPREAYLEETYYHRTARPEGFAVQLVYTDDRSLDEAIQVRDGDVVLVPRGYHPVAAGPGYDLYYLNVMAGPVRRWLVTTDADHRWQLD